MTSHEEKLLAAIEWLGPRWVLSPDSQESPALGGSQSDHPTEQDADELLRGAVDDLRAVLCDPEGTASIHGSVGDLAIVEGALQRIDAHLSRKPPIEVTSKSQLARITAQGGIAVLKEPK